MESKHILNNKIKIKSNTAITSNINSINKNSNPNKLTDKLLARPSATKTTKIQKLENSNEQNQLSLKQPEKSTVISAVLTNKNKLNQAELHQYKIKTIKTPKSDLELNSQLISTKDESEQQIYKEIIMNSVRSNKLSLGTKIMMENELKHAQEAIECGIYVAWTCKNSKGEITDCFRIGSKSMCICSHSFSMHEKILNKKKFSSKCIECKCSAYNFIPQLPEEIGEYWIPHQKSFNYTTWIAKCKCLHGWNEHSAEKFLRCMKCNCFSFISNFCCVVCNKFWQDHEMVYELEHERYMNKKPIGNDFLPFAEMKDMQDLLYKKNYK